MNIIKKCWNAILEFFFPSNLTCMFCGRDVSSPKICYCQNCAESLPFNLGKRCKICDDVVCGDSEVCDSCKSHHKSFDKAVSPFSYEGSVKALVLKLKNDNAKYLAPQMAALMAERLYAENFDFDLIVPTPLSQKSFNKRSFNQAELLAKELGKIFNLPVDTASFVKEKETKHQKELGFSDRQKNLQNAFKIKDKVKLLHKKILLVDDVMTTGATANECAKTLKKVADKVFVVTFARNRYGKK